ncbi:MAG: efflux RND transporter periplasmic adaptor subunit [Bacteroidales bacterium]|nr:efflux RND transporter periplasmic adaptor subunit [Bacteroidales bacterium]MCF8454323.1 efflux RND transporter periplasmic adaptor subunit [Bacteroidales bacterium]
MKRKLTIIGSILAIVVIAYAIMAGLSTLNPEQEMQAAPNLKKHVNVKKVVYQDIESQVSASGRIASQSLVDIASEVQGQILQGNIPLKKGQAFDKGDLLLKIYSAEFELGLQSKKSRFLTSIANILPDFKIDYSDSYQTWTDFFDQIKIDKPMPALPEIKSKQEKIFLASRNILSDYYSIQSDELRLKKYFIYAPFKGVYTQVNSEVGSVANPGSRLGQIIRTDQLELELPIKAEEIRWLNKGDKAVVSTEDGLLSWDGEISRVSQFVDVTTQSISVFVQLAPDPKQPLYNGQYLKAVFPGKTIKAGMEIPRNAVFNFNEVFTVVEGKLVKKTVSIEKYNENSLIFTGLPEGIDVVSEPLINAIENTKVEVIRGQSSVHNLQ